LGSFVHNLWPFILVLGAMIVIHEFGHFIVAKFFGIRVDIFSVGFGKRLFGFKKGDTDYRVSLIPLGGYVKMSGENLDEARTGAPYEFMSKPKWQRFCVAVAGPAMNILTALAIPAVLSMIHYEFPAYRTQTPVVSAVAAGFPADAAGIQRGDVVLSIDGQSTPTWRDVEDAIAINPGRDVQVSLRRGSEAKQVQMHIGTVVVGSEKIGEAGLVPYPGPNARVIARSVTSGWPAEEAGLKAKDEIIKVNGKPVELGTDPSDAHGPSQGALYSVLDVVHTIESSEGRPVTLTVLRGSETVDVTATPRLDGGKARIGFGVGIIGQDIVVTKLGAPAAFKYSVEENGRVIQLTKGVLAQVFAGQRSARDTITGPVGIFEIVGQAAEEGATPVFQMMGLLSLNLGIFNLLPIPVLDGGLIFMLALEALLGLFGLPLTLRVKERMMQVGMVMLMLLMGFVIFNDISKSFFRSSNSQPTQAEQPKK